MRPQPTLIDRMSKWYEDRINAKKGTTILQYPNGEMHFLNGSKAKIPPSAPVGTIVTRNPAWGAGTKTRTPVMGQQAVMNFLTAVCLIEGIALIVLLYIVGIRQ